MKKTGRWIALALSSVMTLGVITACGDNTGAGDGDNGSNEQPEEIVRVEDTRDLNAFEYTRANMTAYDREGRFASAGDVYNGNDVGVFYHTWHGSHETPGKVLDITKCLEENPYYLTDDYLENTQAFHYWGEPLYGYYCSADPWVVTRHIELLMAMEVDFIAYDYTNNVQYDNETRLIFETLQKYYDQGFTNVPKVVFYTFTGSANIICDLYKRYYKDGYYSDLWYKPNGKPLIVGLSEDGQIAQSNTDLYEMLKTDFFDFRETQWPNSMTVENLEIGFPWMNWVYPQKNYNGMMSVSLAQHPGAKMSYGEMMNNGRGYDWKKMRNYTKNKDLGTNYEGQWETVFKNNADSSKKYVNQVLVTGFNEWMAQKLNDGNEAFFVDTFSQEYSRDIEMMKGGYEDNYVIQTLTNNRKFKYSTAKHYIYPTNTISLAEVSADQWSGVQSVYKDMVGDAMARNYQDAFWTTTYVDNSNRNDIATVRVTHDNNNLYVRVETDKAITAYNGTDKNWMNLLISTEQNNENAFGGFQYVVNRTPNADGTTSIEKSTGGYNWQSAGSANYVVVDNAITYSIPLAALGLTADTCHVRIKACDNVTKYDDIMDYYVSGDSAPIGRFAYEYGY